MRRLRLPVAALIVALSPGFSAYEAFAGGLKSGAGLSGPEFSSPASLPALSLPVAPALSNAAPTLPGAEVKLPQVPMSGASAPRSVEPNLVPQSAVAVGSIPQLHQTVQAIERAPEQSQGFLSRLFTGRKIDASSPVDAAGTGAGAKSVPSGLLSLSSPELEAMAADQSNSRTERFSAVKALAQRGTSEKGALERIGTGTPAGDADDYEVKRAALRALAALGTVISLPSISRAHADQILKDLAGAKKPEAAAFDYDRTLEDSGAPVTSETGETLKALADSGVEVMILTDRSAAGRRVADVGILETLSGMPAAQKAAITVGSNRGGQIWAFEATGASRLAEQAAPWTAAEREALMEASKRVTARMGAPFNVGETAPTEYDFSLVLPNEPTSEQSQQAASWMREELATRGVSAAVTARAPRDYMRAYLSVSKYDKGFGVSRLRALREKLGRLRDVERLIPGPLKSLARRLVWRLPKGTPASADATLVVGDQFFADRAVDADMIKGAPGALAISVGGTADPRLENVFVWPTQGHAAFMELARAASAPAAPQMEGLDKKAAVGLFTVRSLSIIAFLGTTLAHAKLSQHVLEATPGAFGTVLALGSLAAIAAGPLMGRIADKLSPRKGMTINLVLRAVFLLDLPLFSLFGLLNFWTLLLGSIANGFLLSSIMTSESAYLRRLFGFKNLGTMNSLLQLNYFALQIIFGLLLGIGKLVDGHNLMIPFYIASAVNAALIPIIRMTMPNTTAAEAAGAAPAAKAPKAPLGERLRTSLASIKGFFKTYWKETALLAAGFATFPFLHSALPITAALVFWITRTEGFKNIKADKSVMKAVGLVALGAFMLYSVQSFMVPTIAEIVGGDASALLNGRMLGSLFLGQMISSSSLAKLPSIRAPLIGKLSLQRIIQAVVLAMTGAWVFTSLVPGSLLAAAAAAAIGAAMMAAAGRLTDRGWLSLIGIGLSALALPALFWGNPAFMLAGLVTFGFFLGPATVSLFAYIQRRAPPAKIGAIMGVQGSLFNAAISLGIGTMTLVAGAFTPAFPPAMWAMAALGAAAGVLYFLVSRTMPGLSKDLFHKKTEDKK